jgi:hypothetical protein
VVGRYGRYGRFLTDVRPFTMSFRSILTHKAEGGGGGGNMLRVSMRFENKGQWSGENKPQRERQAGFFFISKRAKGQRLRRPRIDRQTMGWLEGTISGPSMDLELPNRTKSQHAQMQKRRVFLGRCPLFAIDPKRPCFLLPRNRNNRAATAFLLQGPVSRSRGLKHGHF